MPATWNPSDKYANVTLSNGNKTATGLGGVGAAQCTRATVSKTTGKWYYECRCDTLSQHIPIGFDNGTTGVSSFTTPGQSDSKGITYRDDGVIFFSANGGSPPSVASFTSADVIGIAVDADTGKVWFAKNNTWTSGDPALGTGGYASGITTFYPYVGPFVADAGTGRWATADLTYSVPSGFTVWDGSASTTYNDTLSESLSGADSLAAANTMGAALSESTTAADSEAGANTIATALSESAAAADALANAMIFAPALAETSTAADALSNWAIFGPAIAEILSAADSLAIQANDYAIGENLVLGDRLTVQHWPNGLLELDRRMARAHRGKPIVDWRRVRGYR